MTDTATRQIAKALGLIPASIYIMTSYFEDHCRGVLVSWVQQVAFEPPMVMVALAKGRPIVPLLHDSHAFALCQVAEDDKLTLKRFSKPSDPHDDLFEGLDTFRGPTGSPILRRALAYMDCELIRHIDVDGDHDLYIGLVREAKVLNKSEPIIRLRDNGMKY